MKIGNRDKVKSRMKQKNLNVPKLAREINCCTQTLYNYLEGRTSLSLGIFEKVCKALQMKLD